MANEPNRAIEALADITSMQGRQISDLRESMQQSNQQLSDRIDQMGDRIEATVDKLGGKIDDLAAQVSVLGDNITRLERTVDSLATDTREQHAIARSQSENVAELIKLATALAVRG